MYTKAAVVTDKNSDFILGNIILDNPKENEVLVKIVASGICHTDFVGKNDGKSGYPIVLGHEGAGIVEKIGVGVNNINVGDHVVLSFSYCGNCEQCLSGHPSICNYFNELNFGGKNFDGSHRLHSSDGKTNIDTFFGQSSFAQYSVVNKNSIVKVDKDVDLRYLGPLGCGFQTGSGTVLNYMKPEPYQSLVIFGTGAVGLSALMAAKILGLSNVIVADINQDRLNLALQLGATNIINTRDTDFEEELSKLGYSDGVDYSIDTTGVSSVIKQPLWALKPGGETVLLGIGGDVTFNVGDEILAEGKKITGLIEGDSIPKLFIPKLVNYFKEGRFPIDKLIEFYVIDDIEHAFEATKSGSTIKAVLTFQN